MKRTIKHVFSGSMLIGNLPKGCKYCVMGEKLVLFVTGLCNKSCWYCTISRARWQRDITLANEAIVRKDLDIIREAKLSQARGAGITGGEPIVKFRRILRYIRLLKNRFGENFHLHLYTNGTLLNRRRLKLLYDAGLDEIRFHFFKGLWDVVREALKFGWDVGIEVPVIPHYERSLKSLITKADKIGVKFVNLDELEFSERNEAMLLKLGYNYKKDAPTAVSNSEGTARRLMEYASQNTKQVSVHYCSASTKNVYQLQNRWKRRAKNVKKPYEVVDENGFLVKGVIEVDKPEVVAREIVKRYGIPREYVGIKKKRVETSVKLAKLVAKAKPKLRVFIVKQLPIANGWDVEKWPVVTVRRKK